MSMERLNLKATLKKDEKRSFKDCSDIKYQLRWKFW